MKFNFRNKYEVYLHDTNARGLFARSNRALSHGCVRVQQWSKLANYLAHSDSIRYPRDTIAAWLKRQEKHTVVISEKIPVYIRYFTCSADEGKIKFFDDIYADDKLLRERNFAGR
jgi:murein L,D-transpeptidase YcbB/YkuD